MFPKNHRVHVPRRLRNKVLKAKQELCKQGVDVRPTVVHYKGKVAGPGFRETWEVLGHVWLAFNIGKSAIGAWPKIRRVLLKAGLKNDEIIRLGLSKITRQPKKKPPKKKATKKKTKL